jgi:hypothetical protein
VLSALVVCGAAVAAALVVCVCGAEYACSQQRANEQTGGGCPLQVRVVLFRWRVSSSGKGCPLQVRVSSSGSNTRGGCPPAARGDTVGGAQAALRVARVGSAPHVRPLCDRAVATAESAHTCSPERATPAQRVLVLCMRRGRMALIRVSAISLARTSWRDGCRVLRVVRGARFADTRRRSLRRTWSDTCAVVSYAACAWTGCADAGYTSESRSHVTGSRLRFR